MCCSDDSCTVSVRTAVPTGSCRLFAHRTHDDIERVDPTDHDVDGIDPTDHDIDLDLTDEDVDLDPTDYDIDHTDRTDHNVDRPDPTDRHVDHTYPTDHDLLLHFIDPMYYSNDMRNGFCTVYRANGWLPPFDMCGQIA